MTVAERVDHLDEVLSEFILCDIHTDDIHEDSPLCKPPAPQLALCIQDHR